MILQEKHIIPAVPAEEVLREKSVQCDICKKVVEYRHLLDPEGAAEWEKDNNYESAKTAVFSQVKVNGYDYGDMNRTEYHICPSCFTGKLEPFLQSLGAEPTKVKYDW